MERVLEKKELVIYSKAKVACMVGIALESNDNADCKLVECILKV